MGGFDEWEFSNGHPAGLESMDAAGCSTCVPERAIREEQAPTDVEDCVAS